MGNGDWGMGTGDWGLGTGEWGLGTGDWARQAEAQRREILPLLICFFFITQSPVPNSQSPVY
ncbi:MAG: hypothetical protein V7K67_21005 [Nostoc sp.]|uniref:hypothetical protein n=1 Tax=Nostoc sp. TaxID=1180 RepID=UPI002FFCDF1D